MIGRPVDVAEGPDGALYVSDDYAGSIYRVAWPGAAAGAAAPRPGGAGTRPSAGASSSASGEAARATAAARAAAKDSSAALARGAAVWAGHPCAACHEPGKGGSGVVTRPLKGLAKKYTDDSLAAYLRAPNPPMPAFPLSDAERSDLALYLLSRFP